jgi:hypothetical protein
MLTPVGRGSGGIWNHGVVVVGQKFIHNGIRQKRGVNLEKARYEGMWYGGEIRKCPASAAGFMISKKDIERLGERYKGLLLMMIGGREYGQVQAVCRHGRIINVARHGRGVTIPSVSRYY